MNDSGDYLAKLSLCPYCTSPAPLDDDISVRLEQAHQLLSGGTAKPSRTRRSLWARMRSISGC
jgi:hypothetical protein